MRLSFQERNLICIYHSGSRTATVSQLREALSCMGTHDAETAEALLSKLELMGDGAFAVLPLEATI